MEYEPAVAILIQHDGLPSGTCSSTDFHLDSDMVERLLKLLGGCSVPWCEQR